MLRLFVLVHLECWDYDSILDDKLGVLDINLANMIKGSPTANGCKLKKFYKKNRPRFNLFKVKQVYGWWPFVTTTGKTKLTVNELNVIYR